MATYVNASTVADAVEALAAGARPVAGGTDLVVGSRQGKKPLPGSLVGIHRIDELHEVSDGSDGLRLGALVTHAAIVSHPSIRKRYTGLADASAIVGSHATRANGTIGGNVMNASPAMDTGAPLLCMGAAVELRGPNGSRTVALDEFWTGPGRTVASPDELMVALEIPIPALGSGTSYVRLQYRRQMEIAVVGAAALITVAGGVITDARIAITALAPVIHRIPDAESLLVGRPVDGGGSVEGAARAVAEATRPISDVRASADYRRAMAEVMARRAIRAAITRATGGILAIPASESTYGS